LVTPNVDLCFVRESCQIFVFVLMAFDMSELEGGGYLVDGLDDFVDYIVVIAYVFGQIWDCGVLVCIDLLDQSSVVAKAVDWDWV